ncbi:DUF2249 domain-containing protein [Actinomadura sp. 9N407]|uniref:DUF2249 domain-containing protein n=1 Tax=Actinomadura sp. 9N407 TaxID=3375154 RepID=UPI00379361F2
MPDLELDVRTLRKPDKHPTIFATYADLAVGESFVLVNNHDPRHLREEFEIDHPGGYRWEYVARGPKEWRIRIGKLATNPLPRVLYDTADVADTGAADTTGAIWKLRTRERDLDSNIIHLPPNGVIASHAGPDLDVLLHVLDGAGSLRTELGALELRPGALVLLPRHSQREFTADARGLTYLTVHQRRQALTLQPTRRQET